MKPRCLPAAFVLVAVCGCGRPTPQALPEPPPPGPSSTAPEPGGKTAHDDPAPEPGADVVALSKVAAELDRKRRGFAPHEIAEPYDIQLQPEARKLLRRAKDAYLGVVAARLAEIGPRGATELTRGVQAALDAGVAADDKAGAPHVDVTPAPGHADRVVAVLAFELPCGSDSVLAVLRRAAAGFLPELVVRADDYASITEGRLLSDWSISPPAADGGFYLVTANASPWCTSTWRGIRYVAVAPASDANRPRVLATYAGGAQIFESVASIDARADGFTVDWSSWDELHLDVARPHGHAWVLGREGFTRAAPVVRRPQDVLAEWITSDVAIARGLAAEGAWPALASAHAALRGKEPDGASSIEIDGKSDVDLETLPSHARVRLSCDECTKFPRRVTYDVERVAGGWKLRALAIR